MQKDFVHAGPDVLNASRPRPPEQSVRSGETGGSNGADYRAKMKVILDRLQGPNSRSTLEALSEKQPTVFLKADHTPEQLAALRDPDKVGPQQYGESLVNKFHTDGMSPTEHEEAQVKAYEGLKEKVANGVVDPSALGSEINQELGVTQELTNAPTTIEEVVPQVDAELNSFVERGYLTKEEAQNVQGEIAQFAPLYKKCYPDASPARVYLLARDNARKLAYQIKMDKNVFSGSDHGDLHIIRGNIGFLRKIITSMRAHGIEVTDMTELLALQTNYDHDDEYPAGAAQTPGGFEAMKDHPLVGAAAMEWDRLYYEEYYGKDQYDALFYSVLQHSYPKGDLRGQLDKKTGINREQLRSLTSAVDCLGVTAENKSDSFFRKPETIKTLLQMRLAMEVAGTPNKRGIKVLEGDLRQTYVDKLTALADQEPSDVRKLAIKNAIGGFFNEVTVDRTLALYAAVVEDVGIIVDDKGTPKINVAMQLSSVQALLGGMFGPVDTEAAIKAMRDQGLSPEQVQSFGAKVEQARRNGTVIEPFVAEGASARFTIRGAMREDKSNDPYHEVSKEIEGAHNLSIRTEVNSLLSEVDSFDKQLAIPETSEETIKIQRDARIIELRNSLVEGFTSKTTGEEITQLDFLTTAIANRGTVDLPKQVGQRIVDKIMRQDIKDKMSKSLNTEQSTVTFSYEDAKQILRYYVTQNERDFISS